MLGQAQEVFLLKTIGSKMKEGTLAKLAMQAATFYGLAYEIAQETVIFDRSWLSHMQGKHFHFCCVAQYYKSIEAEANGKYGEQVAWLQAAVASNKSAQEKQIIKNLPMASFENELKTFGTMVDAALQRANKDNDKICN